MAKSKKAKKNSKSTPKKVTPMTSKAYDHEEDTFGEEAPESEETEDTGGEDESTPTAVDHDAVRRVYPLVVASEQAIERAKEAVLRAEEKRSELVIQLRTALGGTGGPFQINGEKFQIRGKGKNTFRVKESPRALENIEVEMEQAAE